MSLKNPLNLIWLDLEMTGLNPEEHVIIEAAVIITDKELNILDQSPSYAITQPDAEFAKMDKWNQKTHTKSGLITRIQTEGVELACCERELLKLIKRYINKGVAPLCGNSVHQDRKFLVKYMPQLAEYFHYRNLDVSTIKELAKRWYPDVKKEFKKHNQHQALLDIQESIEELKFYRAKIMKPILELTVVT